MVQDAILRKLQLLTESSKRVSAECKDANPDVPWRELAGFRNVIVHDYLGIRVDRIMPIVMKDISNLREQIRSILTTLPPA